MTVFSHIKTMFRDLTNSECIENLSYLFWRDKYHVIVEICLLGFIVFYFFLEKPFKAKKATELTEEEKEQLISEWSPKPLVTKSVDKYYLEQVSPLYLDGEVSEEVYIEGKRFLNFASSNFLGITNHPAIKKRAQETINHYGVGSCGPRGFYGSTTEHIMLEKKIAEFYGCEAAVIYSDVIGCMSSVIACFSKKLDLLVWDNGCNYFIKSGIKISHSESHPFKHNDMEDLERVLKEIQKKDNLTKRKITKRFIVVEGLYQYHGDICKLNKIIELKNKYRFRVILEDSFAIGVLSERGSLDYWKLNMKDIEIYCASMNHAFASGCCFNVGSAETCYYQTLGSSGYCFSASAPPFSCSAAQAAIDVVVSENERIQQLKENTVYFRTLLGKLKSVEIEGDLISPVVVLRISKEHGEKANSEAQKEDKREKEKLIRLMMRLREHNILAEFAHFVKGELFVPRPSIRFYVTATHKREHLERVVEVLEKVI